MAPTARLRGRRGWRRRKSKSTHEYSIFQSLNSKLTVHVSCREGESSQLPPIGVLLVDNVEDLSSGKRQAGLLARDQAVRGWVVVEMWLQINLVTIDNNCVK